MTALLAIAALATLSIAICAVAASWVAVREADMLWAALIDLERDLDALRDDHNASVRRHTPAPSRSARDVLRDVNEVVAVIDALDGVAVRPFRPTLVVSNDHPDLSA